MLVFRRGLEAERVTITPAEGEIVYCTDSKFWYGGDGTTLGGILIGGGGSTVISVTGTANRITSTGGANPVIDIDAAYDALWQPKTANLTSLSALSYASTSFVKMTAAGTFALDTSTYLTSAITSLNGLSGTTQTFTNDTNVTIVSGGTAHVITWAGTLADGRIASAATWNAKESALTFSTGLTRTVNTITIDSTVVTLTGAQALSNKTGLISQWTNDSGYLTSTGITPAALTKTDDTNVTLTLGGTPATSLLQAVSLTLGWTGTLADGRIASSATWNAKQAAYPILSTLGVLANASGVLTNDGVGNLSWGAGGSGANTALSNLASVSINTSLLAQNTVNLGSAANPFTDIFIHGAGTYGTNCFQITGTPTGGTKVLTLPNITGTIMTNNNTVTTVTNKAFSDSTTTFIAVADSTKIMKFDLSGQTTAKTLTIASTLTTTQTLNVPNITGTDTLSVLGLAQTYSALKTFTGGVTVTTTGISSSVLNAFSSLNIGTTSLTAIVYRTTNAGSDVATQFTTSINLPASAGSVGIFADVSNQLSFVAANGTRYIQRAYIGITNLTNTAASETGDLMFGTQSGGTAANTKFTITSGGNLKLYNPAHTFEYTIVPAAIAAARTLNLPLITATDTLATLGLAQTWTATQTYSADINRTSVYSFGGNAVQSIRFTAGFLNGNSQSYWAYGNTTAVTPFVFSGLSNTTLGAIGVALDSTNGIAIWANNATDAHPVARAGISITNLVNTSGVESGDLILSTKPATATTGLVERLRITSVGGFTINTTTTAAGTTGNQTINKPSGTVNIAAAGTTVTVTNSLVSATSLVFCVIRTNDTTARITNVVPAAGSFVINIVACTAEVSIGFLVLN